MIQRDDCPLCDQALAVLAAARAPELESVWLADVDAPEAAYGMRVPVLRDTVTGAELDWPFDADRVRAWLSRAQYGYALLPAPQPRHPSWPPPPPASATRVPG